MNVKAKVIQSLPMVSGTRKNDNTPWYKATLVVETIEQYPRKIAISNIKKAHEFAQLQLGATYSFDCNVESHLFNGRWFTEVTCWNWNNA